jgi:hypothetical protein
MYEAAIGKLEICKFNDFFVNQSKLDGLRLF